MIEEYGGARGVLSEATLDYIVSRAGQARHFVEAAAILLEQIAQQHPFVDGNKRTAFAAAEATLRLNGYHMAVRDEDAVGFVVRVARGAVPHTQVIRWIRHTLKRRP